MRIMIFILCCIFITFCTNQKKISDAEMQAYENQLKETVKASEIELVRMKLDIEKLNEEIQNEYSKKISEFETQLNKAESDFNTFKNIENRDVWRMRKSKLDSLLGYLRLKMDTTKTNINQFLAAQ